MQSILSSLQKQYPSLTFIYRRCDVSSFEEQATAFETFYKKAGSIDIVCANAGIVEAGRFLEVEDEDEAPRKPNLKTLDVDLNGPLYCKTPISIYLSEKLTASSNQVGSSLHAKEQLKGEGVDRLHLFGRGILPLSYGASLCYC